MDEVKQNLQIEPNEVLLEKWKRKHRRNHT